jgi:uncharacterized protein YdaU (DUF1376 family)
MNYYSHHIGDFIRDTSRLSDAQCMAYLRMIWMYYETEEPLDCDVDALAFRLGASASDVQQILKHYFFEHEGKWHHSRCDKEIIAFRGKSEKAKKSAKTRWDNANAMRAHKENQSCERMPTHENEGSHAQKTGADDAHSMRTQCERNANAPVFDANQEPVTSNQVTTEVYSPVVVDVSQNSSLEVAPQASPKQSRGTRLPKDWHLPKAWGEWALQNRPGMTVEAIREEAAKFADHWHSKAGKEASKLDWEATWRNWIRNCKTFGARDSPTWRKTVTEKLQDAGMSLFNRLPENQGRQEPKTVNSFDITGEYRRETSAIAP